MVLAGGSRLEDDELLRRMESAMAAGAIGCSVGRNIFMHRSPEAITRALSRVIRERWTAEKAHDALAGARLAAGSDAAMRAAFMTGVNAVEVRETEEPELDPRGALLRVEACGICGTDARTFFNGDPRAPAPWVLGHEPVGVLEEVGPDGGAARRASPRATACSSARSSPAASAGGAWTGFQNLCEHHLLYGYDPFPGAYAEWAAVPPIAIKNLIPLPPDLPSDLATVADPFACALNGIEMLDIRLGDTVRDPGHGADRVLAGGHGPRPRRRAGCS